jgi:hypothetical protein
MNEQEQQLQALMDKIVELLQGGTQPAEIVQMLVAQQIPQAEAEQMVNAVIQEMQGQGGGQGQPQSGNTPVQGQPQQSGGSGTGTGEEALRVIQEAMQVNTPQGLATILQAWDSLQPPVKQQVIQQLSSMSQEGQSAAEQAPQDRRAEMMFGNQ